MPALYIHWPFCKSKCPYCDFNSHVRDSVDHAAWRDALLSELRWYAEQNHSPLVGESNPAQTDLVGGKITQHKAQSTLPPTESDSACGLSSSAPPRGGSDLSSIFFGGGTPSLMPPATVEALLTEAEKLFGFAPDIEITLEANPTSVEAANFAALKAAGVNRVSLGVQSLRPDSLKFLGREHSVNEALDAVALAARIFDRYSFDLIYALPDQSLAGWEAELREALTHADKHLSLYQLTIEPGTQFFHHHAAGKFTMPEGELAADFYTLTQEIMEAAGMPAYEISNHAAPGEASRHNLAYWQGRDYIGIGPGAHGRVSYLRSGAAKAAPLNGASRRSAPPPASPGKRSEPVGEPFSGEALSSSREPVGQRGSELKRTATLAHRSPEKWLAQVQTRGHGQEAATPLSHHEHLEEAILMGLRLREGLSADYLPPQDTPFLSLWPESLLATLQQEGLLEVTESALIPTARGRLLLNSLIRKLAETLL